MRLYQLSYALPSKKKSLVRNLELVIGEVLSSVSFEGLSNKTCCSCTKFLTETGKLTDQVLKHYLIACEQAPKWGMGICAPLSGSLTEVRAAFTCENRPTLAHAVLVPAHQLTKMAQVSYETLLCLLMVIAATITNNLTTGLLLWARQKRQSRMLALSPNSGFLYANIFTKRREELLYPGPIWNPLLLPTFAFYS